MEKNLTFTISITHNRKNYKYTVERISVTTREETYRLTASNKTLTFINNRPLLQKKKLKHWKPTWTMHGELWNIYFRELIIKAIEEKLGLSS